jgi:hypothetical protein
LTDGSITFFAGIVKFEAYAICTIVGVVQGKYLTGSHQCSGTVPTVFYTAIIQIVGREGDFFAIYPVGIACAGFFPVAGCGAVHVNFLANGGIAFFTAIGKFHAYPIPAVAAETNALGSAVKGSQRHIISVGNSE